MRLSPDTLEAKLITFKCLDLFGFQLGDSITENLAVIHPSSQTLGLPTPNPTGLAVSAQTQGERHVFILGKEIPTGREGVPGVKVSNQADLGDSRRGKEEGRRTGEEKVREPQHLKRSTSR